MIEISPYSPKCGVNIEGVDLANLTEQEFTEIKKAFIEHGLVFFRNQNITPEQHVKFAKKLGEVVVNKIFKSLDDHPEIAVISKEKDQKTNIGGGWHTDHSYDDEPAMASILVARELPKQGGATKFANMSAAYDDLSDGLKKTLSTLTALHANEHLYGEGGYFSNTDLADKLAENIEVSQAKHPVIITHPESKRPILYVNKGHTVGIEGWKTEEAFALLNYLYDHGCKNEYTCEFNWQPGSIAIWDNRTTWHYANNDYQGEKRVLHRITIAGSKLSGV
jgi:taurine dioxygenase